MLLWVHLINSVSAFSSFLLAGGYRIYRSLQSKEPVAHIIIDPKHHPTIVTFLSQQIPTKPITTVHHAIHEFPAVGLREMTEDVTGCLSLKLSLVKRNDENAETQLIK